MNVESWCAVECTSSQNWTRPDRKHYDKAFKSRVFSEEQIQDEGRVQFQHKIEAHKERRHFPEKRKLDVILKHIS